MENKNIKFAFFGTGPLAESALYSLYKNNLIPSLVITSPDKRSGRKMELHSPIIKTWCESKNIKVWQPINFKDTEENNKYLSEEFDVFIVASYPKILPESILNIPKSGTLNVHPSLLPKYRGPSPIQTALLNGDNTTGITIIKLDKEVDHGPILIQKEINILDEDINEKLERKCGAEGGEMILQILEHYLEGNIKLIDQDHDLATFTRKFDKKEGEIKLEDKAEDIQNKFKAFLPHIPLFFFINHKDKEMRVKISQINLIKDFAKDKLAKEIIEKVIPEGKSEMNFEDFERGYLI
ncbi:MAG: methionyl-tRNA formyltransferase [Candidatus Nomurabacteria bacterium]